MNQQMVDEAGNIWEVDASGNPVRFVGSQGGAPQAGPQPFTLGQRDPSKAVRSGLEMQNIQGQIDERGRQSGRDLQKDAIDRAAADRAALEWAATHNPDGTKKEEGYGVESAALRSLVGQINRTQALFDQGAGSTSGLYGVMDYFPTAANTQLDTAGASLSQQGLAAFRVPGTGTVSDRDAMMFDRANLPQASGRDAMTREQLHGLRSRVDAEYAARGLPAPQWNGDVGQGGGLNKVSQNVSTSTFGQPGAVAPNNPMQGVSANGAKALASQNEQELVGASEGGWYMHPNLGDLGATVKRMIQNGRGSQEIIDYVNGRYEAVGSVHINAQQRAQIGNLVSVHRKNPTIPVGQLATDWGNFGMVPGQKRDAGAIRSAWETLAKSPVGAGGVAASNAVSAGMLDEFVGATGGNQQVAQAVKDQARAENPISSLTGEVVGGTIAMTGLNRGLIAAGQGGARIAGVGGGIIPDIAYGAAYGAGESNENRVMGAFAGGAGGGLGSAIGRGAVGMFGRGVRGVSDPAVRYLTERGVPLSLGQVLGNTSKAGRMWNKMESLPYVGDMMGARRLDSKEGFNRLAFEEASTRYPGSIIPSEIGEGGARQLGAIRNAAYADALDGVRVAPDQQFADDLAGLAARGQGSPLHSQSYASMMMDDIRPLFRNNDHPSFQNNELTGEGFQAARQTFQGAKKSFENQPMGYQMQSLIGDTSKAFDDLLARQAPEVLPKYNAANDLNRHISALNKAGRAAKNSEDGLISPAQLKTASYNNTVKYGGEAQAAAGNYPFRELIENSEKIIPSRVPDSGTVGRGLATTMPFAIGAGAGVGGQQGWISPETAALIGSVALLSSKTGAKVAQNTLVKRPDAVQRLGQKILARRRIGGMFGAGFGAPLAVSVGVGAE